MITNTMERLEKANALIDEACEIYRHEVCSFMGCSCCTGNEEICPYKHIQRSDIDRFTDQYRKKLKERYLAEIERLYGD
jgi:hypothetical protein